MTTTQPPPSVHTRRILATAARLGGNTVDAYAFAVVRGEVPAGKYHRLACERHLQDRERENTPGFPYVFQIDKAKRFFEFAEALKHYSGKRFAGQPILLSAVQQFRLGSIFGWRHVETGMRRFTSAYNELPRKSGKTLEAAIVALYVTFFEGEPGAEGYCIATKRDQAKLVWGAAKNLVKASGLRTRIVSGASSLFRQQYHQKLEPLGADADSTDGLNPYLIITDEFHAHKTRKLFDVMQSAVGARPSFLHFIITTAGDDPVSPCGVEHEYACRILDRVLDDNPATLSYFAFIAHADPEDDWTAEATWWKANPHLGISIDLEIMRKLAQDAIASPEKAPEFQQKRLNLWVNRQNPSLSMDGWRKGQGKWLEEEMYGQRCYAAWDLSSKLDLTSLSLLFPPAPGRRSFRLIQRIWTPGDTIPARAHRDRAPYDVWVKLGWLIPIPGTSIKQSFLRDELNALADVYEIEMIGYDAWHSEQLQTQLVDEDGWPADAVIEVPQTFAGLTAAETRFKAEVLDGNVDARGCPVTAWAASNVVDTTDGKMNIMFSKKSSRGRIDPIKSATIALACFLRQPLVREPEYQVLIVGGR